MKIPLLRAIQAEAKTPKLPVIRAAALIAGELRAPAMVLLLSKRHPKQRSRQHE
jgi:hypothetical protein